MKTINILKPLIVLSGVALLSSCVKINIGTGGGGAGKNYVCGLYRDPQTVQQVDGNNVSEAKTNYCKNRSATCMPSVVCAKSRTPHGRTPHGVGGPLFVSISTNPTHFTAGRNAYRA